MRFWALELHPAHQLSKPGTDPTLSLTERPENLELVCVPAWVYVGVCVHVQPGGES